VGLALRLLDALGEHATAALQVLQARLADVTES
jgi:hypothetical protein